MSWKSVANLIKRGLGLGGKKSEFLYEIDLRRYTPDYNAKMNAARNIARQDWRTAADQGRAQDALRKQEIERGLDEMRARQREEQERVEREWQARRELEIQQAIAEAAEQQAATRKELEKRQNKGLSAVVDDGRLSPLPPLGNYADGRPFTTYDPETQWIISGNFRFINNDENVYAIAYDIRRRCLLVQYKHWAPGMPLDAQAGPGPIYEYSRVEICEASAIYHAQDIGLWLWDNVRVRGSWSLHKKPYRLVAISGGYLPRKSTMWNDGREWWIRRQMLGADGHSYTSQLRNAPAPPMGFDGKPDRSNYHPYRGRPDDGRPNK